MQETMRTVSAMAQGVLATTMLDLVYELTRTADDDDTVVARVISLVRSGRVQLTGTFRGVPASVLFPADQH